MAEVLGRWDFYVTGKKAGTAQKADVETDSPGSIENAAEGCVGRACAPVVTKLSFDFVDVFGSRPYLDRLYDALVSNTPITVTLGPINSKLRTYNPCWVINEKRSISYTDGKATGTFGLESRAPTITG
jgi:hypothetical protein